MMLPLLSHVPGVLPHVANYLHALKQAGFAGDLASHYADRLSMSTDNSVYQLLPQAVLFPRTEADVVLMTRLATQPAFGELRFTPRGGGTGTNGQALNDGIVVDFSRYMNQILEINLQEGWVRVEAGVIKDQLNHYLRPHGYFFSPELSTSNRATLGGMINTDASGQGSLVYGKTSDHVLGLRAITLAGERLATGPIATSDAEQLAQRQDSIGLIYQTVLTSCLEHRQLIEDTFPKLNRFLTGYDLKHVLSDDLQTFDLSRIIAGSEGTLAFITEAKLNITSLPKVRRLVNINYDSFDSALRNAPLLVQAKALSVETIDSTVLDLAREDIVWHSVKSLIKEVPEQNLRGLNIVEFAGDDEQQIGQQVDSLCQQLDHLMQNNQAGVIGYQLCDDLISIERIYAMRKKAVGLLGNSKNQAKPLPFVEDTCVPPEHLADYIAEFRALLDQHQLTYGMFGHVDAGVLHVRPALDMCDPPQEVLLKTISDQVVTLTAKYGGLLWGEHGKGFRSEYSPAVFGETLYKVLRCIKAAFDPLNRLNPGKICTPLGCKEPMINVNAIKRGTYDRQIPLAVRTSFRGALDCNGNGLCFNFDVHSPMCPSMKISNERIHSPKGRASLVREWLRLLAAQGVDPTTLEQQLPEQKLSLRQWVQRWRNGKHADAGEYDFSHEVKEAMAGCLACKACSTQCPIKIDVPGFRSRFLQLYHSRYPRPLRDYMVANVERYAPVMAAAPKFFNFFLRQTQVQRIGERVLGMTDMPLLSSPTLKQQLIGHHASRTTLEQLEQISVQNRGHYVLIVQDPFTSYYDARVVADFVHLVEKLKLKPVLLPFSPNGKAQHIKGFLHQFAKTAKHTADFLNRIARLGMPMIGVDPALVLCYRDEYKEILGNSRGDFNVQLVHEWLLSVIKQQVGQDGQESTTQQPTDAKERWHLLGHCTESTLLPESGQQWQQIFRHFGEQLNVVNVGCCGMAGTYGHEVVNHSKSMGIYALSWQSALHNRSYERCLATGYSCRSQVKRAEGATLRHPLQALLEVLS